MKLAAIKSIKEFELGDLFIYCKPYMLAAVTAADSLEIEIYLGRINTDDVLETRHMLEKLDIKYLFLDHAITYLSYMPYRKQFKYFIERDIETETINKIIL